MRSAIVVVIVTLSRCSDFGCVIPGISSQQSTISCFMAASHCLVLCVLLASSTSAMKTNLPTVAFKDVMRALGEEYVEYREQDNDSRSMNKKPRTENEGAGAKPDLNKPETDNAGANKPGPDKPHTDNTTPEGNMNFPTPLRKSTPPISTALSCAAGPCAPPSSASCAAGSRAAWPRPAEQPRARGRKLYPKFDPQLAERVRIFAREAAKYLLQGGQLPELPEHLQALPNAPRPLQWDGGPALSVPPAPEGDLDEDPFGVEETVGGSSGVGHSVGSGVGQAVGEAGPWEVPPTPPGASARNKAQAEQHKAVAKGRRGA